MIRKMLATLPQTEWLYVPNVPYHTEGGLSRTMQCIIPHRRVWREEESYPLVLFIPGAAWQRQEMYNNLPALSKLAQYGYAIASIQVREAALASFPTQVEDVQHALDALAAFSATFHWDMDRLVLAGDSSGAHIALMTMLTTSLPYPVRGVIDLYGPTDLLLSGGPMIASLLGVEAVQSHPELAEKASCTPYITTQRAIPPMLIAHGTADDIVSIEHSRRLYQTLQDCGKTAWLYEIDGAGHGGSFWWSPPMLELMDAFMKGLW